MNAKFITVLGICFSCHLLAVHETAAWECDRTDIPQYIQGISSRWLLINESL